MAAVYAITPGTQPKFLVSIRGKPLLYHAFDRFAGARFVVIGGYLFDQIIRYMVGNPPSHPYKPVKATGKGTLSGLVGRTLSPQVPADVGRQHRARSMISTTYVSIKGNAYFV
jgi:hypothetical protein